MMTSIRFLGLILFLIAFSGHIMAQDKPSISVTSNNQQGGITAYQVNIGRVDLTFSKEVASEMVKHMPKDKPVDIRAVGSQRDQQVAQQYAAYLQSLGYTLRNYTQIGAISPPPDYPITITVSAEHTELLISPRS